MPDDCAVRKFVPEDLPRLHAIRRAAFAPIFQSFRDMLGEDIAEVALANADREQAEYLEKMCGPDSEDEVYVVAREERVVGFFTLALNAETKVGRLDLNAVDPDDQGHGIGTMMYADALDRMKAAGMLVATVGTGGDPSHAPARRTYEKVGFGPSLPGLYLYKKL